MFASLLGSVCGICQHILLLLKSKFFHLKMKTLPSESLHLSIVHRPVEELPPPSVRVAPPRWQRRPPPGCDGRVFIQKQMNDDLRTAGRWYRHMAMHFTHYKILHLSCLKCRILLRFYYWARYKNIKEVRTKHLTLSPLPLNTIVDLWS